MSRERCSQPFTVEAEAPRKSNIGVRGQSSHLPAVLSRREDRREGSPGFHYFAFTRFSAYFSASCMVFSMRRARASGLR